MGYSRDYTTTFTNLILSKNVEYTESISYFCLDRRRSGDGYKAHISGKNFRAVFFDGAESLCYNIRRETRRLTARRWGFTNNRTLLRQPDKAPRRRYAVLMPE